MLFRFTNKKRIDFRFIEIILLCEMLVYKADKHNSYKWSNAQCSPLIQIAYKILLSLMTTDKWVINALVYIIASEKL